MLDGTHDPALDSWVVSANAASTDFPLQNLPFGRLRPRGATGGWRIGVAIGDEVLDLRAVREQEVWGGAAERWLQPLSEGDLNAFMALGPAARRGLRRLLCEGLSQGSPLQADLQPCVVPLADVELGLPCRIGDYTEFDGDGDGDGDGDVACASAPAGRAGRVSSIGLSGQRFHRPFGVAALGRGTAPAFGPSQQLDFAPQLGVFVGVGNVLGRPLTMEQAEDDWFGLVLLDAWTARDLRPPFLARNFATTMSPWIVTQEALAPFRVPHAPPSPAAGALQLPPHLDSDRNLAQGGIDLRLEVLLHSAAGRAAGTAPQRLLQAELRDARWTVAQLLSQHSSNGCNLQPGDLLGLDLGAGHDAARAFLQDGDTVLLRAHAERAGARRIGFGACAGTVLPALQG
jgi:fumarylacetoacetase